MYTISIHEAQTQLDRFVDQAAAGEEIVISRAGKPVARLMPLVSHFIDTSQGEYHDHIGSVGSRTGRTGESRSKAAGHDQIGLCQRDLGTCIGI
ncbi:MAG: type II toxin-antitoxin system prevent-host-death family antitoxin [Magnetococcales bacterium]|nr:type II toxin-antitoxin system prevent-host-death family antitoxin [Magnetococcales bacterium]